MQQSLHGHGFDFGAGVQDYPSPSQFIGGQWRKIAPALAAGCTAATSLLTAVLAPNESAAIPLQKDAMKTRLPF